MKNSQGLVFERGIICQRFYPQSRDFGAFRPESAMAAKHILAIMFAFEALHAASAMKTRPLSA
jgi:hypothetical protein